LVLDKDPLQLELLSFLLKQEGHEVHATPEPDILFDVLRSKAIDLVLVETALPNYDGDKLCWQVRHLNSSVALMIVSERDREEHILRGLLCADEYVTKPFSPRQLLARVNALLRRTSRSRSAKQDANLTMGEISLSLQQMNASVNGHAVELTAREFSLLYALMEHPNRVLSREQLMQLAWGDSYVGVTRAVDVCILRLRKKIRAHLRNGDYLRTERGFGYKFVVPGMTRDGGPSPARYDGVTDLSTTA
jgi:two-component system alkaline phosphatase synthesis response regulator PhoP